MESDFAVALGAFVAYAAISLFYLVVYWRIFNKAHRSGVLLLLNFLVQAALPWLLAAEPELWLWVAGMCVSWLLGLGILTSMISIISRPGWWLLPYLLVTPAIGVQVWAAQARVGEELDETMAFVVVACVLLAALMAIPMYFVGMSDLGDAFGKGVGFRIGLMFMPFVFLPILAFDRSRYGSWGAARRERPEYPAPGSAATAYTRAGW